MKKEFRFGLTINVLHVKLKCSKAIQMVCDLVMDPSRVE